jgi:glycosyltransferase involved in cell wall biosynthesis
MKILWVKSDFLHPAVAGGRIRTLEILKRLRPRHEIHYAAFLYPDQAEALSCCGEYCSRAYPVPLRLPDKRSLAFALQLGASLFSRLPLAVSRYRSLKMQRLIASLRSAQRFDAVVCDFLVSAINLPDLSRCFLFQHNVETLIWQRHHSEARDPLRKFYFRLQARRMEALESRVCRQVAHIIAVSDADAQLMRSRFGVPRVSVVPTGVDLDFFAPPPSTAPTGDLVFIGAMDWLPNIDGVLFFVREILPLIRRRRPGCTLTVAGRNPGPEIRALVRQDPLIRITGTVEDIRPCLWASAVSIVPLRIGGGTRLKIYESMAARVPVVSTSVGAEGLDVRSPDHFLLADTPAAFAEACLELLEAPERRASLAESAWCWIAERYSWPLVARRFEEILEENRRG